MVPPAIRADDRHRLLSGIGSGPLAPGDQLLGDYFSCSVRIGSQSSPGGAFGQFPGAIAKQRGRPIDAGRAAEAGRRAVEFAGAPVRKSFGVVRDQDRLRSGVSSAARASSS